MRHAHAWLKQQRRDREPLVADEWGARIHDCRWPTPTATINAHITEHDRQLEASIQAYRARKAAA